MFGFGRHNSHSQLVRAELGECLDHFKRGAGHAVDGRRAGRDTAGGGGPRLRFAPWAAIVRKLALSA
jgi:hypothetical protein